MFEKHQPFVLLCLTTFNITHFSGGVGVVGAGGRGVGGCGCGAGAGGWSGCGALDSARGCGGDDDSGGDF